MNEEVISILKAPEAQNTNMRESRLLCIELCHFSVVNSFHPSHFSSEYLDLTKAVNTFLQTSSRSIFTRHLLIFLLAWRSHFNFLFYFLFPFSVYFLPPSLTLPLICFLTLFFLFTVSSRMERVWSRKKNLIKGRVKLVLQNR